MKSFCIKTNNKNILAYLLNNFNFPNTYISIRKFKIYKNIIIHYIGENASAFYNELANNLVSLILNFYEENLLKSIIKSNYFYF